MSDDPKERMWEEAIARQLDDTRGKGCLTPGEWLAVLLLGLVIAVVLWNFM